MTDWTSAWTRARALALSAPCRSAHLLARPRAAPLLAEALRSVVEARRLPLLGWLILPDGLHVVGLAHEAASWPASVGTVKQVFTRRWRRLSGDARPPWREEVRVRPLAEDDVERALRALASMPVQRGLCRDPAEWPWLGCPEWRTRVGAGGTPG